MGIFDRFRKAIQREYEYAPNDEKEAWVGLLYACIIADGEIMKVEENSLSLMLITKKKFENADIPRLYRRVADAQHKIGGAGLVDACAPLIEKEDRPTLFSMSVELVLADGILDDDEEKIIEYIAKKLLIPDDLVERIVEVMLIRNRGNQAFF
jgi:uncharacterized tellurite resistance protein B-like protein